MKQLHRLVNNKKIITLATSTLILIFLFSFISYMHIQTYSRYIVEQSPSDIKIAVVLGGGVRDGKPLPLLKDRLDKAKQLLDEGFVEKVVLSGDNRFESYNEPAVMVDYLLDAGIDDSKLQADFAGRSTFETCERARKVFGLQKASFISEDTHLPRVLYLCRHFGIEAYGVASNGSSASGLQIGQRWREILARNKAILNVNFIGEKTVLGEPITF